jgi:UDP-N-acetyl-D-mannosaminuronic acid transferase (WecB/TagA/CpsF family)
MLTIPAHKGKANQKHIKIPPHSCQNGYHQEQQQQMVAKMWGKRNPHILLVGM